MTICADAFQKAVETAYKAVMKPKEGTILTVARGAAEKAAELALEDRWIWMMFFAGIIEEAERVLATDTGDAAGSERGRRGGFRRTGSDAGTERRL